jgi:hypothetical protein
MEQAIMLLVFALAAALCLRAFVWADVQSAQSAAQDHALLQAQNAAETLKSCGGDLSAAAQRWGGAWDGMTWTIQYDNDWAQTEQAGAFTLRVTPEESGLDYLGAAHFQVERADGQILTELRVCWQEG